MSRQTNPATTNNNNIRRPTDIEHMDILPLLPASLLLHGDGRLHMSSDILHGYVDSHHERPTSDVQRLLARLLLRCYRRLCRIRHARRPTSDALRLRARLLLRCYRRLLMGS